MAAFRSRPGGDRLLGWQVWAVGLLAAWMAPVLLGVALLALAQLAGWIFGDMVALAVLGGGAYLMVFSMMFAALWLIQLVLLAWLLLRLGAGGWLSLLIAGAACGALGISFLPGMSWTVGLALGTLNALVLWIVFSRMQPNIFTAG
jgi:hypothetical protein